LENDPKAKAAYEKGILAFVTIGAWLVYKLDGGLTKNGFVRPDECLHDVVHESKNTRL